MAPASDTHARIVEAAADVFAQHGLAATRVEDLLVAADVSRRTFYKHFRNKEEVLAALYELATAQLVALLAGPGASLASVHHGLDAYLDFHRSRPKLLAVLVPEAIRRESILAPLRRRFRDQLAQSLAAAAKAEGCSPPDRLLSEALLGALESISLHLIEHPPTPARIDRAKTIMRTLLSQTVR